MLHKNHKRSCKKIPRLGRTTKIQITNKRRYNFPVDGAPRLSRSTLVLTESKFDRIFNHVWYEVWAMPPWAPYSFEEKEYFRNVLWAAVEELL